MSRPNPGHPNPLVTLARPAAQVIAGGVRHVRYPGGAGRLRALFPQMFDEVRTGPPMMEDDSNPLGDIAGNVGIDGKRPGRAAVRNIHESQRRDTPAGSATTWRHGRSCVVTCLGA